MKEITQKELYNQVWQKSMNKSAPEYGLSDVRLAKIYKKHNIPLRRPDAQGMKKDILMENK